jgi:hypothetical protein
MDGELIRQWQARVAAATTEAIGQLARCDVSPVSDGVLGDWMRSLVCLRFTDADLPAIVALIGKSDPHLQEAGIELATAAVRSVSGATEALDEAIARLLERGVPDSWVVHALVDYLAVVRSSRVEIYEALARFHLAHLDEQERPRQLSTSPPPSIAPPTVIARNRYIDPWRDLVRRVYDQSAIQTLRPTPADLAVLPVLERVHGTRGWDQTQRAILTQLGTDPDEYFARLRQFGR